MLSAKANPAVANLKMVLWMVVGAWAVVTGARMINGIGASSGLSDATPWGFWIAMVESGVAFAAGGFVIAAVVYIFGIERYHDFARRAILVALLGYLTAATGLFFELGLPWNIWHPMIYWQHHSVLFEVAMCVMCYLSVLALEFSPALLEHPLFGHRLFQLLMRVIKALTIPLVIAGIMLSTLHQSSLGSLFLIQPYRVHPLWYSPMLPVLFYVSAIGLGLMVVTLESLLSGWLFRRPVQVDKLAGLGRIASIVLTLYLLLRLGDLWRRDKLFENLDGSFESALFMVEMLFSAALPAALLAIGRVRRSIAGLATCGILTFLGVVGYRFNICYVAFMRPPEMQYYPTWTEIMVTAGVVAGALLLFLFFNENLRIVGEHGAAQPAGNGAALPLGLAWFTSEARRATQRHSLLFVSAGALAFALLPKGAVLGPRPVKEPALPARTLEALATSADLPMRREFFLASLGGSVAASEQPQPVTIKVIDGNQNWRYVAFAHDDHATRLGGNDSCRVCHHQNAPFDRNTACAHCHRDMYEPTDTFDHYLHARKLGGNESCELCHAHDEPHKARHTALACWQCHGDMVVPGSFVPPLPEGLSGHAPGYMNAMHKLCIGCHEDAQAKQPEQYAHLGRCDVCHREYRDEQHKLMAPYVRMPVGHALRASPGASVPAGPQMQNAEFRMENAEPPEPRSPEPRPAGSDPDAANAQPEPRSLEPRPAGSDPGAANVQPEPRSPEPRPAGSDPGAGPAVNGG